MAAWTNSPAVKTIALQEEKLEHRRKEVFEASRFDPTHQRLGLFSFPGPLSAGCDAAAEKFIRKRTDTGAVALREKNFSTKQPLKGSGNDALFSAPEHAAGEYAPPMSLKNRLKPEEKTEFQKAVGPYQPHGTFHEAPFPYEYQPNGPTLSPNRRGPDGKVTTGPKNFVTANLKKGNPNSTPGLTLGQNYPHMADPYDRKEMMLKEERAKTRQKVIGSGAFQTRSFSGKNFSTSEELYHEEGGRQRRPASSTARNKSPWRPNNPAKSGIHDMSLGHFPEHMPSPPPAAVPQKAVEVPWR